MLLLNHELNQGSELEEIQGLWGPLTIEEKLLQKIWSKQTFAKQNLQSESGQRIAIRNPGKWNKLEGPDFLGAQIEIDGIPLQGDVEIHFHKDDWFSHGHERDEHFRRVILHVLLFPPRNENPPVFTLNGYCPETLVLLKYLDKGLEEYALEDALLTLEDRNHLEILEGFIRLNRVDQARKLYSRAKRRFELKRAFAKLRIKTQGWDDACHQMALEVLGYKRNRIGMSTIALKYPLSELRSKKYSAAELYTSQKEQWKTNGIRPANHPLKRIEQYCELIRLNPDWPQKWKDFSNRLGDFTENMTTAQFRRKYGLTTLAEEIKQEIFGNTLSGTRFHTLLIDALIPLAAAHHIDKNFLDLWMHWFSGDIPDQVTEFIKKTPLLESKEQTHCNGLNQGVLQLFSEMCI